MATRSQPTRVNTQLPISSSRTPGDPRPLLVSVEQATRLLGVGRTTLYHLVRQGQVTPVKIGRAVRFPVAEIEQFVARLIDNTSGPGVGADRADPQLARR